MSHSHVTSILILSERLILPRTLCGYHVIPHNVCFTRLDNLFFLQKKANLWNVVFTTTKSLLVYWFGYRSQFTQFTKALNDLSLPTPA